MICKLKSDGSGGFSGISNTFGLGSRKHIAYCGFHILVLFILSTALQTNGSHVCLCLTLALQRSNEMYKTIKHPYRRVLRLNLLSLYDPAACVNTFTLGHLSYLVMRGCTAKPRSRLCRRQYWFRLQLLIQLV